MISSPHLTPENEAITENTYDKNGNIIAVTNAMEAVTRNQYNALNQLIATSVNPSTGQPSDEFDGADDIIVANRYDFAGNLISVADGAAEKTFNGTDWEANQAVGHVTTFTYDGLNRKTSQTWDSGSSVAKTETWTYDAMVQLTHTDAKGITTSTSFDELLRPTALTFSSSGILPANAVTNETAYSYKAGPGPLLSVTYPNDSSLNQTLRNVHYTHDRIDRVLSETSAGVTHDYTYDVAGNRIMVKYGNSNRRLITKYDDLNRVKSIIDTTANVTTAAEAQSYTATTSDAVTAYQYNISGNTVNHFHPNGTATANEFDLLGRMKRTVTKLFATGALLSSVDYSLAALSSADGCGYDKLGNVRYMVENSATLAQRSVTNVYDKTNRLVEESVNQNECVTSYTYDAANNRTRKTVTGTANTDERYLYGAPDLGYNTNQLVAIGDNGQIPTLNNLNGARVFYTYDDNGNRATRSAGGYDSSYFYDIFNRLITLDFNKGNSADTGIYQYVYDYRTRRVLTADHCVVNPSDQSTYISTYGSNVTRQSFSGGSYVQTYEGNATTPSSELIRGNELGGGTGGLLYSVIGGVATHNAYNSRGDVVNQSNASGVVTYEAQYEAFGTRKQESGSAVGRQKANTKDEDPTGLLNEGFRYRDLETGIFLTRDPMGFVDGPNVYTYVVQNPWTSFDPEGLAGYFFDGTGNDKDDNKRAKTHVAGMWKMYKDEKFYMHGAGTRTDKVAGTLTGKGMKERMDGMMEIFREQYKKDPNIEIYGFSRGAAMAREFAHRIQDEYPGAKIRFMGLFDTVAQEGLPDPKNHNPGLRLDIASNVQYVAHAIAKNEHRDLFPVTSVTNAYGAKGKYISPDDYKELKGSNFWEKAFDGCHSDIGGSYANGANRDTLKWMMKLATQHGVRFDRSQLDENEKKHFSTYPQQWHDERRSAQGILDRRDFVTGHNNRKVYPGNLKAQ